MRGHLEWVCEHVAILRIGPDDWQWGEHYAWAATVLRLGPDRIAIKGAMRQPTLLERRAIDPVLDAAGIRYVEVDQVGADTFHARLIRVRAQGEEAVMAYSNKQALADVKQEVADTVKPKTNARQAVKALLVAAADDMEAGLDAEHEQEKAWLKELGALMDQEHKEAKAAVKARRALINQAVAAAFANTAE